MNATLLLLFGSLAGICHAQGIVVDPVALAGREGARIRFERSQADGLFSREEVKCYQKFAVNDCLGDARAVRRDAMADLRRQELAINAAEARRRGAEQISKAEDRVSPQAMREAEQRMLDAQARQQERLEAMDERARARERAAAEAPARAAENQQRQQARREADAERAALELQEDRNRQVFERKQEEAARARGSIRKEVPASQ